MRTSIKVWSLVLSEMRDEDKNLRMRSQKIGAEHLREGSCSRHAQVACTHNRGALRATPHYRVGSAYSMSIVSPLPKELN
jgi:hypothetical protein